MKSQHYVIFLFLLFISCRAFHTQRHDEKKIDKIHSRNELALSNKCAQYYPLEITSIKRDTNFKPGKPIIVHDTVSYEYSAELAWQLQNILPFLSDSIRSAILDSVSKHKFYIKVPGETIKIHDTIIIDNSRTVLDSAATNSLRKQNQIGTENAIKYKAQRNIWMWIAIGLLALTVFLAWFTFQKKKIAA